ncbi:MAG: hypothetical protein R3B09_07540 [Nannocystaceae bacterium]
MTASRRLGLAVLLGLGLGLGCAATPPNPAEMRDLWVPRDASRGLVIDASSSQVWTLHLPAPTTTTTTKTTKKTTTTRSRGAPSTAEAPSSR